MKKQINQVVRGQFTLSIITVFLSVNLLTGCAKNETTDFTEKMSTNQESIDKSEEPSTEIRIQSSQETQISSIDSENLSDDAIKVQEITEKIFVAYFKGDEEAVETYILDTEEEVFESSPNAGEETSIPEYKIKGLEDVKDMNLNGTCVIWCEFNASPEDDYFQYLTIVFVKKEEGWKVRFMGIEM